MATVRNVAALVLALAAWDAEAGARAAKRFTVYRKWPFDAAEAKRRQAETAKALGVKVEQDFVLVRGTTIRMVLIPAGEFMMGSSLPAAEVARLATGRRPEHPKDLRELEDEHPRRRVVISRPFWMGKYEVTQAQWQPVMGIDPSQLKGAQNPADCVSWNEIQDFLRRANAGAGQARFALPTEAQWEYTCRAGTATPFHFGQTISTDEANYYGKRVFGAGRVGIYRKQTTPVGSFPSNAWGLHDMHGNVWEWCADWYAERCYAASPLSDPPGPPTGRRRVLRGGSWYSLPYHCRSANRARSLPSSGLGGFGSRLVCPAAGTP